MNPRLPILTLMMALGTTLLLPASQLTDESTIATYRDWHLGMSLADAEKRAGASASDVKVISSRPERVEEMHWRSGTASSTSKPDSVREILFRFYNGELFEIMITYDRSQTGGMTDDDMKEALGAVYGPGSAPAAKEMRFNSGYESTVQVVAQWADGQDLLRLVALPYDSGYGLFVSSTATQTLAKAASLESERLDHLEAPQRERDLKASQAADTKDKNEKSRLLNKPGFRP